MSIVAILVRDTIVQKTIFFFAVNSYNTGCNGTPQSNRLFQSSSYHPLLRIAFSMQVRLTPAERMVYGHDHTVRHLRMPIPSQVYRSTGQIGTWTASFITPV